jgi:glycosyltransferase involved in cell wall biosynthesis
VEEVGRRLVERGHKVIVYCRMSSAERAGTRPASHLGMQLVHLPALPKKTLETLSHTTVSVAHLIRHGCDVAVMFNAANAPLLPALRARRIPVATHVDGLEWKRAKWAGVGRRYYRLAESLAVRWSDALIADAKGIQAYYQAEFDAASEFIAYGAPILSGDNSDRLADLELLPGKYHLVVARFEPENHVDVIVEGYRRSTSNYPLVVVGSAPYADDYTSRVRARADERVTFLGAVWDQDLLDQLYANAATYVHGHSVGGTNPSLLRAIGAGSATIAYDVNFNREVLGSDGRYFATADDVAREIVLAEAEPAATEARGAALQQIAHGYDWDDVARRYEDLCQQLVTSAGTRAHRPSGRRARTGVGGRSAG